MSEPTTHHALSENSVPCFWPLTAAAALAEEEWTLFNRNLKFLAEAEKIDHGLQPTFASRNRVLHAADALP